MRVTGANRTSEDYTFAARGMRKILLNVLDV